jgi:hypothetical protein
MRVVSASNGNGGKGHLAEFGEAHTLCGRTVTAERFDTVAADDRCKRCTEAGADDMWTVGPVPSAVDVPSNRPADVPAVADGTPAEIAVTGEQIHAIERLFVGRLSDASRIWTRQMVTGEIVILDVTGDAPSAEEIGHAIGEPVHLIEHNRALYARSATYRLDRDNTWCRACKWINGHRSFCPNEAPATVTARQTAADAERVAEKAADTVADAARTIARGMVRYGNGAEPVDAHTVAARVAERFDFELSFDQAESLGLDGTGRDGHAGFPFRWSTLTDAERAQLLVSAATYTDTDRCQMCAEHMSDAHADGCPVGELLDTDTDDA